MQAPSDCQDNVQKDQTQTLGQRRGNGEGGTSSTPTARTDDSLLETPGAGARGDVQRSGVLWCEFPESSGFLQTHLCAIQSIVGCLWTGATAGFGPERDVFSTWKELICPKVVMLLFVSNCNKHYIITPTPMSRSFVSKAKLCTFREETAQWMFPFRLCFKKGLSDIFSSTCRNGVEKFWPLTQNLLSYPAAVADNFFIHYQ